MSGSDGVSTVQGIGLILVGLLLAVYGALFILDMEETRDAEKVESVQVSLQVALSRGVATLQLPPNEIHPANIVNDARTRFPKGVKVSKDLHLTLPRSGREAQFRITREGDMVLVSLKRFTRFHVEDGRIMRNTQWTLPVALPQQGFKFAQSS